MKRALLFLGAAALLLWLAWPMLASSSGSPPVLIDQTAGDLRYSLQAHTHDHGANTDLLADDHTQYLLLAGRGAGGQTITNPVIMSTVRLTPSASPPFTCDASHEGYHYSDTSHAACFCDGTTWLKLVGAGTCA